jgi:CelD/BcsL family acetyltransferase involved in cellulose biosynthesis
MKIVRIDTEKDFESLKDKWNKLLLGNPNYSVFMTWEWMFTWWEYFNDKRELLILLAYDKDQLSGIVPLMISRRKYFGLKKLEIIEFIGSDSFLSSDYFDFLSVCGQEQKVMEAFIDYIWNMNNWHVLNLTGIYIGSQNIRHIKGSIEKLNGNISTKLNERCLYVSIKGNWESYIANLKKRFIDDLKRRNKKLKNEQEVSFDLYNKEKDINFAIDCLIKFNIERLAKKEKVSSFSDPTFSAFFKKIGRVFNSNRWLKLYCLSVKNKPVAICCNFVFNNKAYQYQNSFDGRYAKYSPSHLLLNYALKDSFEQGYTYFDFLGGNHPYKSMWANKVNLKISIKVFKKRIYWKIHEGIKMLKRIKKQII